MEHHLHPHTRGTPQAVSWLHNPLPPIVVGNGSIRFKPLPTTTKKIPVLVIYSSVNLEIKYGTGIKSLALLDANKIIFYKYLYIYINKMQSTNIGEKQISRMFKAQEPKEKKKML